MKQSTKLLSMVLALIMAFSCASVIGNAALTYDNVTYDAVDDAIISADDGATLLLDMVENDLLVGMETIDLSVLGQLRLSKIDYILEDLYNVLDNWMIGGVAISTPDLKALTDNKGVIKDVRRSGGDINVVKKLLQFLGTGNVPGVISKIPYGIATSNGISLGALLNGIVSGFLGDINDTLTDLPGLLNGMVYDLLIYGSYDYPLDAEEVGTLPEKVNNIDKMLNNALLNLLYKPQDYEYVGEDENAVKVWDENSYLLPSVKAEVAARGHDEVLKDIDLTKNSFFGVLDNFAQFAIDDLGVNALNHNLKKGLMEAVEVEFNEIEKKQLPADAAAAFADESKYVTYISYDCMYKSGNTWYYTTLETDVVIDETTGEPAVDEDGNEITERVRKYFKANTAAANEFYGLINWDWNILKSTDPDADTTGADNEYGIPNAIDYEDMIATYGSIAGSLNYLVYFVFENAIDQDVKDDFADVTGDYWFTDPETEGGDIANINDNLNRMVKYLLANFADKIFGQDSVYANEEKYNYEYYEPMSLIDIVALIGPSFFEDAMPQLIMPVDETGAFAFAESDENGSSVALLQFAALVLREFMTEIAPSVNYDAHIFAANTLTSATGRQFANHSAEDWFNIILNMGVDIGATYLVQITNFKDYIATQYGADFDLEGYIAAGGGTDPAHWQIILDEAILWAANYVGANGGAYSVIYGLEAATLKGITGPLNKLSHILNTLLPLGFINGCTSASYDFDVSMLVDRLKGLLTTFDLTNLAGLFGRNTASKTNILDDTNLVKQVLNLANNLLTRIFYRGAGSLLPTTESCAALLTNENIKSLAYNLLTQLYAVSDPLLYSAVPVACKLIKDIGGEQEIGEPQLSLGNLLEGRNGDGTLDYAFTLRNGSSGLWRGYKTSNSATTHAKDKQYTYNVTSLTVTTVSSDKTAYTVNGTATGEIAYGATKNLSIKGKVPTTGSVVVISMKYKVNDEDGKVMANGAEFEKKSYAFIAYRDYIEYSSHEGSYWGKDMKIGMPYYLFLAEQSLENISGWEVLRYMSKSSLRKTGTLTAHDPKTQNGITINNTEITVTTEDWEYAAPFTFNASQYKSPGHAGAQYTFNFELHNGNKGTDLSSIVYLYNADDRADLTSIANDENRAFREESEYKKTTVYADELLNSAATVEGATDADTVYQETAFTTTGTHPETGETVTVIDGAKAWTNYYNALIAAIKAAYNPMNDNTFDTNSYKYYEALRVARNDLELCKKTTAEIAAEGGVSLDGNVDNLKTVVDGIEAQYSDTKDYTDYKMHRWNRYNDARNDAKGIIDLKKRATTNKEHLDEYFTYTGISEADLRALVADDANEAYILALLEKYEDEEIENRILDLERAQNDYAGLTALDVAQAQNLVTRFSSRLLPRTHGVRTYFLDTEIASAMAMIGDTNKGYTARSWAKYEAALKKAKDVAANPTQMTAFDAKYNLLVARNELVKDGFEADYTELEALIAQAEQALANKNLYDNINKEFGQVLAELGYNEIKNADGDSIQLFPGSAKLVLAEGYSVDDQGKVDRAAEALKEALARLKFKNVSVTYNNVAVNDEVLVEDDDMTVVDESVVAKVARIAAQKSIAEIKAKFAASASGITVTQNGITITNDFNYAIEIDGKEVEEIVYVGTNATVTFYTTLANGTMIPVATSKIVVEGDLNGDGVLDVLDANIAQLAATEHAELDKCYFLAANLNTDTGITANDYSAVVNKALA